MQGEVGFNPAAQGYNKYNKAIYGRSNNEAWCSTFVWWVFKQAGASKLFVQQNLAPSCYQACRFFEKQGRLVTGGYRPGDIVYYGTAYGYSNQHLQHTGIIEKIEGEYVHTIEGNFSKMVRRRTEHQNKYLKVARPAYDGTSSGTPSGDSLDPWIYGNVADVYMDEDVKSVLGESGKVREMTHIQSPPETELLLVVQRRDKLIIPMVEDGITLTTTRYGVPGELRFSILKDAYLGELGGIQEGDPVRLTVCGKDVFYGFIFDKSRGKNPTIDIVAYDQLRYLKNKDTITTEQKKASELLQMIAQDQRLRLGDIVDTGYVIPTIVEDNQSYFEMINNALDETLVQTGKLHVLYDDFGKLTLKNIEDMKLDVLIDGETAEDYSYSSSINERTSNKIKLAFNNSKTGKRDIFIAQDPDHMNEWGVLQHFEVVDTDAGAVAKVDGLLKLYNEKSRRLTIKKALGDPRVRAGCSLPVSLNLGDLTVSNYMICQRVKHTFSKEEHTMDLTLVGGGFYG